MAVATLKDLQDLHREMLTMRDVADYFGVSIETAHKIARKPGFPLFRNERTLRVPKEAFLKWLAQETGQEER